MQQHTDYRAKMCCVGLQLVHCDMSGNQLNGSLPGAWSSMAQVSKSDLVLMLKGEGAVKCCMVRKSTTWTLSIASSLIKQCCFYTERCSWLVPA